MNNKRQSEYQHLQEICEKYAAPLMGSFKVNDLVFSSV